jgi:hypothetical protein
MYIPVAFLSDLIHFLSRYLLDFGAISPSWCLHVRDLWLRSAAATTKTRIGAGTPQYLSAFYVPGKF